MLKRRRKSVRGADISMLNLIDVIFMLLIFFMIATTFNNYTQFQVSVPKSKTILEEKKVELIEIIIDKNREIFLKINENVKKIEKKDINNIFLKIDKNLLENVTLTADEKLEYKEIVEIIGELKNVGIENINLNIQKD